MVAVSGDGREAVKKARELRPDLIVMDLDMPDIDKGIVIDAWVRVALVGIDLVDGIAQSTLRETIDELLQELQQSPIDLAKLVTRVHERRRSVVAASAKALARWNKDDPTSWTRVREWLTTRDVRIVVI
jgi:DNA-binding NarL/FixJ family response regulator